MEAEDPIQENQIDLNDQGINVEVDIVPIENHYFFVPSAKLNEKYRNLFVKQSFILFVLELRTGMNDRSIDTLKRGILDFCEEALERGLSAIGFVINGEYFTIKKPNYEAVKEILVQNMKVSQEDNYLVTLRKLRHVISSELYKYDKQFDALEMVFFTSYVHIDHSLGQKKRSYIDKLNEHSADCLQEIRRTQAVIKSKGLQHNCSILTLDRKSIKDEDYSMADHSLYNSIAVFLGSYNTIYLTYYIEDRKDEVEFESEYSESCQKMAEGFKQIATSILSSFQTIVVKVPLVDDKVQKNRERHIKAAQQFNEDDWLDNEAELKKQFENEIDLQSSEKVEEVKGQKQKKRYSSIYMTSSDLENFYGSTLCLPKQTIDLYAIKQAKEEGIKVESMSIDQKLRQQNKYIQFCKIETSYTEPDAQAQILYKTTLFNSELRRISQSLKKDIVKFKRIYDVNGKSHLEMQVDEDKQQYLRERVFYIEKQSKELYALIFDPKTFSGSSQKVSRLKRNAFESYSSLKLMLDTTQQVMMNISKKQIKNDEIGKICQALTYWGIKKSLKNKLIRRVNLNPGMIDETYARVSQIVEQGDGFPSLETINKDSKHRIGNCIQSGVNFATALRNKDCLAILIEVERPQAAIADPGRVRIRQISPFSMTVSNFFKVFHYGIDQFGKLNEDLGGQQIRMNTDLEKSNYKEMWDYWDRAGSKYTVPALIPVYLCKENWQVAKLLMKPCLGWTATGEPLGYTFAQVQNLPFMAISAAIRRVQELKYAIAENQAKIQKGEFHVLEFSELQRKTLQKKRLVERMEGICVVLEETCQQITRDLSFKKMEEENFAESIVSRYKNYVEPINRTVDVICNNSAFLSQVYVAISLDIIKKPTEKQFHEFFKRLVEEELRRETDGWNQEQTQDKFIDRLLNSQVEEMDVPDYIIVGSKYFDAFETLQRGEYVRETYLEIQRKQLEMMLKKDGKFNQTQQMSLIEYKRLYENRVLWMWYVRFRLYGELERISIHKWKGLDLKNSYQVFTMIIQNKKQRKNSKRREAINSGIYVDPFDYYQARQFLQKQFVRLRAQKEKKNVQILNAKAYNNAATTFAMTKSLEEAAGCLINIHTGKQIPVFYEVLREGHAVRIGEKLQLLLLGSFKGVTMFSGWKMAKRRYRKLQARYPYEFSQFRWNT